MIIGIRHKGLEIFYRIGSTQGVQATHAAKLTRILQTLDAAKTPAGMDSPDSACIR